MCNARRTFHVILVLGLLPSFEWPRERFSADWTTTLNILLSQIATDKSLILGTYSLLDLYTQLYLCDMPTGPPLRYSPRQIQGLDWALRKPNEEKWFLARDDIPPVVHVVLVVPREKLTSITKKDSPSIGTQALHLSISQNDGPAKFDDRSHSFHCFFGKIDHASEPDTLTFEEDEQGWQGACDLIVSCAVAVCSPLTGPRHGIRVSLRLARMVGSSMSIYETGLDDTARLFVCRDDPGLNSSNALATQRRVTEIVKSERSSSPTVVIMDTWNQPSSLKKHIDFPQGLPERDALTNKEEIAATQSTPCTALLKICENTLRLVYPFCVNTSKAKFRVARKCFWLEVEVPISSALEIEGDYWTQMVLQDDHPPIPWIIPRVTLAIQPELRFPTRDKAATWVLKFLTKGLSKTEKKSNQNDNEPKTPRLGYKEFLATIFDSFVSNNDGNGPVDTFQLFLNNHRHTLLFITSARHDLDLASVILDAYVVPLTLPRVRELIQPLTKLQDAWSVSLHFNQAETTLWKTMLPTLAERYRRWKHKPGCEYCRRGAPMSTAEGQTPLCGCGEGRVDEGFLGMRCGRRLRSMR